MKRAWALVLCVVLLVAGCGGGNGDEPPETATSAPAGPTLPPFPTRSPQGTPTPVAANPPGSRTEVPVIDRVLEAVESRDPQRLSQVLSFHAYRCDNRGAAGSNPCPPGVPEGTPVDVIASGSCEAAFLARDSSALMDALRAFLDRGSPPPPLNPRVYAVVETQPGRLASPLPLRYLVIFASAHTLVLDDAGVTHLGFPCGAVSPADLFHPADTVILAPP